MSGPPSQYDWVAIQHYFDAGHTRDECAAVFGFHQAAWYRAIKMGRLIVPLNTRYALDKILASGHNGTIKKTLIRLGILKNVCAICGLGPTWLGNPLILQLDHINGIHDDDRVENLRLLCPNCDSQTITYRRRNVRRSVRI